MADPGATPELANLSPEEAALIEDVLRRLSLEPTQARPAVRDPDLEAIDAAEQAIEQELRSLQTATPPAAPVPPAPVPAPTTAQRQPPQPVGLQPVQPTQQTPPPAAPVAAPAPQGAGRGVGQPPQPATQPANSGAQDTRPAEPMPPRAMSLLQEMREQLRKQQQQQQPPPPLPPPPLAPQPPTQPATAAQPAREAAAAAAGAMPSPRGSSGGLPPPPQEATSSSSSSESERSESPHQLTHQPLAQQRGTGTAASAEARGGAPPGPSSSPGNPSRRRTGGSASSVRRSAPPLPADASKAFTMLNARTSVDRYGGGAKDAPATSAKPPVKLSEQERSARLQQLYERTSQWRKRCEERYAKTRHEQEESVLQACTFSPAVAPASHLILQGKPPSEVYEAVSKYATPTKHQPHSPRSMASTEPASALATRKGHAAPPASAAATPKASHGGAAAAGPSASPTPSKLVVNGSQVGARMYSKAQEHRARQEERVYQQLLEEETQRRFKASTPGVNSRVFQPSEPAPPRYLPTGMAECTFHPQTRYRALSSRAFEEGDSGLEQRFDDELRPHSARAQKGGARPDGLHGSGVSSQHSSSGAGRPKSAPHQRPDGQPADTRSASVSTHDNVRSYKPGPGSSAATGHAASSVHSTVSIGPELDWNEFLARQGRFLADREHKLQQMEPAPPPPPKMSPGSKRLLQEREARLRSLTAESSMGGDAEGSKSVGAAPAGRPDRRMRTVVEMYRECTFQPQITRKAAALPNRSVDDFVDGGRTRREEWAEQQRALQAQRELEGVTFKPQITKDAYAHVRPRINLKNVDAYLAHVEMKRRQREELCAEVAEEREALELQHCTFKPQTTPLPAYLIKRLQEQQQQEEEEEYGREGDVGDHVHAEDAEGPDDGVGYDEGYGYADGGPDDVAAPLDNLGEEELASIYERALMYAGQYPVDN